MVTSHAEAARYHAEPGDGPEPLETSAVFRFEPKGKGHWRLETVYDSDWSDARPIELPPTYGMWVLEGIEVVDEDDDDRPMVFGTWRPASEDEYDEEPDLGAITGEIRWWEKEALGQRSPFVFERKALLKMLRDVDDMMDDPYVPPSLRSRLRFCWDAFLRRLTHGEEADK